MSQSYSRVVVAAHKSLHGCGIICWYSLPGKPGASFNLSIGSSLTCVRPLTSKTTGNDGLVDKDAKQKGQSTLQDGLKYLRSTVAGAGARVQDGIHSSREKFLSSFYSLQTQPENTETKSGGDEGESGFGEGDVIKTTAKRDASSTVSLDEHCDPPSTANPEQGVSSGESDSRDSNGMQKESPSAADMPSQQTIDNSSKYSQTDFWINIPSFQDRINRLKVKAPFQWTNNPATEKEATVKVLREERTTKRAVQLTTKEGGGSQHKKEQMQGKSRDANSLKPESYDITAEVESEHIPDQHSQSSKDPTGTPSLRSSMNKIPGVNLSSAMAMQNVIKSIPGLKSDGEKKVKPIENESPQGSDNSDDFNLDASPILYMNVALQEEPSKVQRGVGRQVIAKETEEARMRKARTIEAGDVTAKKPRKQMKPVISKACIDDRTKNLAIGIRSATNNSSKLLKLERLAAHLLQYPESREVAVKEKLIPTLLKIKTPWDGALMEQVNETLALLGYAAPAKGRGLRILSIDGGGTRGVIAIETLREIERRTNKPVRELFDYVMGVSSGAVLGFLLAFDSASLDECEDLYRELSRDVFKRNTFLGTSKLFLSHAFYDTEGWIKILKSHSLGATPMISTARNASCPKVAAVATMMNVGCIKDFLFRNYNLPPGTRSHYRGSCKYDLWQAVRASSAAPGYFEECKLEDYVFQDGGVLTNNPCALAIHECRLLWPDTPIQCVLSVGCGRYDPEDINVEAEYSSLKKKLTNIMVSATDTESVHTVLQDLLPSGTYFRFNPPISEDYLLDENRAEKIEQMQQEARDYLELNELKLEQASGVLSRGKTRLHKALDWLRLQRELRR